MSNALSARAAEEPQLKSFDDRHETPSEGTLCVELATRRLETLHWIDGVPCTKPDPETEMSEPLAADRDTFTAEWGPADQDEGEADTVAFRTSGIPERRRPLEERHDLNDPAQLAIALEEAHQYGDEIADIVEAEPVVLAPFVKRIALADAAIAAAEAGVAEAQQRVEGAKEWKATLEWQRDQALEGNRESKRWRTEIIHSFVLQPQVQKLFRRTKHTHHVALGRISVKWTEHNAPRATWAGKIGPDGNETKAVDEPLILQSLAEVAACGLDEERDTLLKVTTDAKVLLAEAKKHIGFDEEGKPWWAWEVPADRLDDEVIRERIRACGGGLSAQVNDDGEVTAFRVIIPAVVDVKDAEGETVMTKRPIIRRAAPPEPYTVSYELVKPGRKTTDEEEDQNGSGPEDGDD